ncbi:MAG: cobalamin biosynthesis protein CobW [Glaciihabitans sp.]|nr:cobalamin biosynthesis protein CobW [Glaciihabitans sp.]
MMVTLVAGLRDELTARVVRTLGAPAGSGMNDRASLNEVIWPNEDDPNFAIDLAARLEQVANDPEVGSMVIELAAQADVVEVALVLQRLFAERRPVAADSPANSAMGATRIPTTRDIRLRDLITATTAADIRQNFFREGPDPVMGTSEALALQLEIATTITVSGLDAVTAQQRGEIRGLLLALNPTARILQLAANDTYRRIGYATAPASTDHLGRTMGWMLHLSGTAGLPLTHRRISALVYRDPRPFHPGRLSTAVENWLEPAEAGLILRSRGLVRLASRADRVGSWSTAGAVLALDPTAMTSWDGETPSGQELVFFGRDLNRDYITLVLDSCLLTNEELVAGPMEWQTYSDPFPVWNLEHGH